MTTGTTLQVTDSDFAEQVEGAEGLVLVDFWAAWCGPCRAVAPVLERLAQDYRGRVKVVKLDTDANPLTTVRYQIRSIPAVLLFKDGRHVDTIIGADPRLRSQLDAKIAQLG